MTDTYRSIRLLIQADNLQREAVRLSVLVTQVCGAGSVTRRRRLYHCNIQTHKEALRTEADSLF